MKKSLLVLALALYASTGFAGTMDGLKETSGSFAKGFGVGLAHGAANRVIYDITRVPLADAVSAGARGEEIDIEDLKSVPKLGKDVNESMTIGLVNLPKDVGVSMVKKYTGYGITLVAFNKLYSYLGEQKISPAMFFGHAVGQALAENVHIDSRDGKFKVGGVGVFLNTNMIFALSSVAMNYIVGESSTNQASGVVNNNSESQKYVVLDLNNPATRAVLEKMVAERAERNQVN